MIKKLSLVILISFLCSGCSLLPRITFDRPGVTPTSTEKSYKKESCAGDYKVDAEGNIISCSRGYYKNEQNYKQAERKFTFQERIANFIRGLAGWGFIGLVLVLLLVPGLAGWLIGRVFNVFHSALTGTVRAISNFKKNAPTVVVDGVEIIDPRYMKAMDALLDELETEHSKDPAILKTINDMRLRHKIEDND